MDALARYVRMRGGRVFLISGTDALESYVLQTATRTGTEPASVARRFHRLIETDLGSLDIETDAFIDPLAPPWAGRYRHWIESTMTRLSQHGRLVTLSERVPYDPRSGR